MKTVPTVLTLVKQVKADNHDSVYLFSKDGKVAVAYDSFDADVVANVAATIEVLEKAESMLEDKVVAVFTDAKEWRDQLNEWHGMGGGDGNAW